MKLVEIIPAIQTDDAIVQQAKSTIDDWGKLTVLAKDTPGFIVNKVARPFYSEALRIYEEGIADFATIDWAITELGGFRMGPFTLMDFIGNDVNYVVTETVFARSTMIRDTSPHSRRSAFQKQGIMVERLAEDITTTVRMPLSPNQTKTLNSDNISSTALSRC